MLVLSLERLSKQLEIDAVDRTVLAGGGVLLSQLDAALAEHGLLFPIDLGADPTVGGMVATNAAGTRVLRYGDVRQNLLGARGRPRGRHGARPHDRRCARTTPAWTPSSSSSGPRASSAW